MDGHMDRQHENSIPPTNSNPTQPPPPPLTLCGYIIKIILTRETTAVTLTTISGML